MNDTPPKKVESSLVSVALIMLIALPCLFEVVVLRFFDGPGMGAILTPIYQAVSLVCSVGSGLGFARLIRLRGFGRLFSVVLFAIGLFALSRFVTFWVSMLLFMPRH